MAAKVYENGAWRDVNSAKVYENGAWRDVYPNLPAISDGQFLTFRNKIIREDIVSLNDCTINNYSIIPPYSGRGLRIKTPTEGSNPYKCLHMYMTDAKNAGSSFYGKDSSDFTIKYGYFISDGTVNYYSNNLYVCYTQTIKNSTTYGNLYYNKRDDITYPYDDHYDIEHYEFVQSYESYNVKIYAIIGSNSQSMPWDGVTGFL